MKALVISVDGSPSPIELPGDTDGNLIALQGAVGGYVERLPHPSRPDVAVFVNEEGKVHGQPVNATASRLVFPSGEDWVAGTCVVVGQRDNEITDIPEDFGVPA